MAPASLGDAQVASPSALYLREWISTLQLQFNPTSEDFAQRFAGLAARISIGPRPTKIGKLRINPTPVIDFLESRCLKRRFDVVVNTLRPFHNEDRSLR